MMIPKLYKYPVLLMLVATTLIGCATTKTEQTTPTVAAEGPTDGVFGPDALKKLTPSCRGDKALNIAFFLNTQNNTFVQAMKSGAEQAAKECNIKLDVFDAKFDTTTQINQIEDAITAGKYTAFVIQHVDSVPIVESAKNAIDHKIIVSVTNSPLGDAADRYPGTITYVGHKEIEVGKQAGQMALDALGEKCGKILIVSGLAASPITQNRTNGFAKNMSRNPNCKIVSDQPADFDEGKAQSVIENLIQAHPDAALVYADSDNMACGAITALKAAGKQLKVVSVGASEQGLKLIASGEMYGTIYFRPFIQGQLPTVAAAVVARGAAIADIAPYYNDSGNQIITRQNVTDFRAEW